MKKLSEFILGNIPAELLVFDPANPRHQVIQKYMSELRARLESIDQCARPTNIMIKEHADGAEVMETIEQYATHRGYLLPLEPVRSTPTALEVRVDVSVPPDEFHMIDCDGKRHVFKLYT